VADGVAQPGLNSAMDGGLVIAREVSSADRRRAELDQTSKRLRADRDEAVRVAHRAGLSMREIARILGMSHQRVFK
jgi:DNA-directed RNA polymerase specialized sigma24 family protein